MASQKQSSMASISSGVSLLLLLLGIAASSEQGAQFSQTESSYKQEVQLRLTDFLVQQNLMVGVLQTTDRLFNTHQQVLQQIEIVIQAAAGQVLAKFADTSLLFFIWINLTKAAVN